MSSEIGQNWNKGADRDDADPQGNENMFLKSNYSSNYNFILQHFNKINTYIICRKTNWRSNEEKVEKVNQEKNKIFTIIPTSLF